MQISTAYSSTSLSLLGQTSQLSTTLKPLQVPAPRDQVQVSEQALGSSRKAGRGEAQAATPTLQLLGDLVSLASGQDVEGISELPMGEIATGFQQMSIATESVSPSLGGTISAREARSLDSTLISNTITQLLTHSLPRSRRVPRVFRSVMQGSLPS